MPIDMRLPKLRGNTSADAMPIGPFRTSTQPVNLRDLEARFDAGAEVTPDALVAAGLIKNTKIDIKILGSGELTKKLSVTAHGFSKSAKEKIEAAGGTVSWLRGEPVPKKPKRSEGEAASRPTTDGRGRGEIVEEAAPAEAATPPTAQGERRLNNAELARQRLACPGAAATHPLHRVRARRLPARLVDARRPASTRARSRTTSRATAARSSGCSTSSRAARCRSSRCSRSGSCRT